MTSHSLGLAIKLAKSGRKAEAEELLSALVKREPENVNAWLWLASITMGGRRKRRCLEKALELDPENETAKLALARLEMIPDVTRIVAETPVAEAQSSSKQPLKDRRPTRSKKRLGWKLPLAIGTTFLCGLLACPVGVAALSNWVESESPMGNQVQTEPTSRVIALPPTWTPTVRPVPTATSPPTAMPSPTQDPHCPDASVEEYRSNLSIVYDSLAEIDDEVNSYGRRSVLTSKSASAAVASLYKTAYAASLTFNPPPCIEVFHNTWIRYLELTHNMWLAASVGNYELALQYNEQSLEFIGALDELNQYR